MAIDRAALVAYVTKHNQRATFEGHAVVLARICRRDLPAPDASPKEHSRPWFAREILLAIEAARQWRRSGHPDIAMAEALTIGILAASAMAHHPGPWLAKWVAFCKKQGDRSRAGIETKRDNAARVKAALLADVRSVRLKHPDHARRAIANMLLSRQGYTGDRRKALDALAKRIARLEE